MGSLLSRMGIKTLDRYIFREVGMVFLLGMFIVMAILFLEKIHFLSRLILDSDLAWSDFGRLLMYVAPAFAVVSMPMAMLLASLITFSNMSNDNEMTAMRACGIGFSRVLIPVTILAVIVGMADLYLSTRVQHIGNYKFITLLRHIITDRISLSVGERVFFDKIKDTVIYVSEKPSGTEELNGIFIFDSHNPARPEYITAEKGEFLTVGGQVVLRLENGSIYNGDRSQFRSTRFDSYEMVFDTTPGQKDGYVFQPREMSIKEMEQRIVERKARGEQTSGDEVEIYKRYAMPFTAIILAMLGAPLGLRSQRGSKWGGLTLGIGAIITNYILLMLFEGLGREGSIPAMVAIWIPNVIMASAAAYLIYTSSREMEPFKLFELLEQVTVKIGRLFRKRNIE